MEKVKLSINNSEENKLPSNIEAEQSLIGSVLVNNDIIDEISNIVNVGKFFDPIHRKIYEVIENLNNKGMIANPITLKNYFENDSGLSEVGGSGSRM
jgi:replicative DNA helicase